jgi:hypothetical protein
MLFKALFYIYFWAAKVKRGFTGFIYIIAELSMSVNKGCYLKQI